MGAVFVGQLGKLRDGCQPSHSFATRKGPVINRPQDATLPHSADPHPYGWGWNHYFGSNTMRSSAAASTAFRENGSG
jgi:hypothetical protein